MDNKEEDYLDELLKNISLPTEEDEDLDALGDEEGSIGLDGLKLLSENAINNIIDNASLGMDEPVVYPESIDDTLTSASAKDPDDKDIADISDTLVALDSQIAVDNEVQEMAIQAEKDEEEAGRISVEEIDGLLSSVPDEKEAEKKRKAREKEEKKREKKEKKAAEREAAKARRKEKKESGEKFSVGGFFGKLFGGKKKKPEEPPVIEGLPQTEDEADAAVQDVPEVFPAGDDEIRVPSDDELAEILSEVESLNMDGTPVEEAPQVVVTPELDIAGLSGEGDGEEDNGPGETSVPEDSADIPDEAAEEPGLSDDDLMNEITQGAGEEEIDLGLGTTDTGSEDEEEEEGKGKKKKKKKGKKEKGEKKGLFSGLAKLFSEALDDDEEEGAKVAIGDDLPVTGIVSDENQAILNELDQELDQIPEGKKKKKKKEKKPKKEKKKKEKKPKKPKEPREKKEFPFYMPKVPKKSLLLVVLMSITITALVMVVCLIVPAQMSLNKARKAFDSSNYAEAYEELYGQKLNAEDREKFEKSLIILKIDRYLSRYDELVKEDKRVESLDVLLQAVDDYEALQPLAQNFGIEGQLGGEYSLVLRKLSEDFGLTEEDARSINGETDDLTYTERVYEAAGVPLPAEKVSDVPDFSGLSETVTEPPAQEPAENGGDGSVPSDGAGQPAEPAEGGETAPPQDAAPPQDEGTVLFDIRVD